MIISIIVTVYNLEKYIIKTLESLNNQSNTNFEIIIVNDGSTDNSLSEIEDYCSKHIPDSRYKIINQKNMGVSVARNTGLAHATSEYVMFLDGDDLADSSLIDKLSDKLKDNVEILIWGYDTINQDGQIVSKYFEKYKFSSDRSNGINVIRNIMTSRPLIWIWTCSAAYKTSFLSENGLHFTPLCINGEDQEFIFKALAHCENLVMVNNVLTYYVVRDSSITNSYNIRKFDSISALDRLVIYLKNLNNNFLSQSIDYMESNYILELFLGNLVSCLRSVILPLKVQSLLKIHLKSEIDDQYPFLHESIEKLLQSRNKKMSDRHKILLLKLYFINEYSFYLVIWVFIKFNNNRR